MDEKQKIGSRIKALRTRRGLTQDQLSEKMEISPKYLSSIERGLENPTLNTLIILCQCLDINLEDIFVQLENEDPAECKSLIVSMLDRADGEQVKTAYKILSAIIH